MRKAGRPTKYGQRMVHLSLRVPECDKTHLKTIPDYTGKIRGFIKKLIKHIEPKPVKNDRTWTEYINDKS